MTTGLFFLQFDDDGETLGEVDVVEEIEGVVDVYVAVLIVVGIVVGIDGITVGEVKMEQQINGVVLVNAVVFVYVAGNDPHKSAFVAGDVLFTVVDVIGSGSDKAAVIAFRVAGIVKGVVFVFAGTVDAGVVMPGGIGKFGVSGRDRHTAFVGLGAFIPNVGKTRAAVEGVCAYGYNGFRNRKAA